MNQITNVQKIETENTAREQLKLQLAHYLEQQPESTQTYHQWMKRLEVASVGVIAAAFIAALYISVTWKSVNPILIPVAWFFFAASPSLAMVFVGLHSIILRAFPPVILPGKVQRFVTGSGAVWAGAALIVGGVIMAAFWLLFAYSVGTFNLAMVTPLTNLLGIAVSITFIIQIVNTMAQKVSKSR